MCGKLFCILQKIYIMVVCATMLNKSYVNDKEREKQRHIKNN